MYNKYIRCLCWKYFFNNFDNTYSIPSICIEYSFDIDNSTAKPIHVWHDRRLSGFLNMRAGSIQFILAMWKTPYSIWRRFVFVVVVQFLWCDLRSGQLTLSAYEHNSEMCFVWLEWVWHELAEDKNGLEMKGVY